MTLPMPPGQIEGAERQGPVRRDVRSANWDGGSDLSSVDTDATEGYLFDYSVGAIQLGVELLGSRGAWSDWSPSYVSLTIGNGTIIARYTRIGNLIVARFSFTLGSTSSVGTAPTVSAPVTASSSGYGLNTPVGSATMEDAGTTTFGGRVFLDSTTTFRVRGDEASATYVRMGEITASIPMTWTTSDVLSFTATYEAA